MSQGYQCDKCDYEGTNRLHRCGWFCRLCQARVTADEELCEECDIKEQEKDLEIESTDKP